MRVTSVVQRDHEPDYNSWPAREAVVGVYFALQCEFRHFTDVRDDFVQRLALRDGMELIADGEVPAVLVVCLD